MQQGYLSIKLNMSWRDIQKLKEKIILTKKLINLKKTKNRIQFVQSLQNHIFTQFYVFMISRTREKSIFCHRRRPFWIFSLKSLIN